MFVRVDVNGLAADAHRLERVVVATWHPPLETVTSPAQSAVGIDRWLRERCGRSRLLDPLVTDDALAREFSAAHGHQSEARVVAQGRVKTAVGADARLILA